MDHGLAPAKAGHKFPLNCVLHVLRLSAGQEQEVLAKQAGFRNAVHYEIAFGLMGVLVLQA